MASPSSAEVSAEVSLEGTGPGHELVAHLDGVLAGLAGLGAARAAARRPGRPGSRCRRIALGAGARCPGAGPPLRRPGHQPLAGRRSPPHAGARRGLLHDRLRRPRGERRRGHRRKIHRPRTAPLPLRRLLPRAQRLRRPLPRQGGARRGPGPRRVRRRADRGRAAQGLRTSRPRGHPADVHDRESSAPGRRGRLDAGPAAAAPRPAARAAALARRRPRRRQLRGRLGEPLDRHRRDQRRVLERPAGHPDAPPARLRGQRPRHLGAHAAGLGGGSVRGPQRSRVPLRRRARPARRAADGSRGGAGRARATPSGAAAPVLRPDRRARGVGCRVGVPNGRGDRGGPRARSDRRHDARARRVPRPDAGGGAGAVGGGAGEGRRGRARGGAATQVDGVRGGARPARAQDPGRRRPPCAPRRPGRGAPPSPRRRSCPSTRASSRSLRPSTARWRTPPRPSPAS